MERNRRTGGDPGEIPKIDCTNRHAPQRLQGWFHYNRQRRHGRRNLSSFRDTTR